MSTAGRLAIAILLGAIAIGVVDVLHLDVCRVLYITFIIHVFLQETK